MTNWTLDRARVLTEQTEQTLHVRKLAYHAQELQQLADDAWRDAQQARVGLRDLCSAADRTLAEQGQEPLPELPEDVRP